jgi:hypothetical protein
MGARGGAKQLKFQFLGLFLLLGTGNISAQDDGFAWHEHNGYKTRVATRLVNTHSTEQLGKGELDFRILHRFGTFDGGWNTLFGLDQAQMRISFDYGVLPWLSVGVGRSSYQKEYDGFLKLRLLKQRNGKDMPLTVTYASGMVLNTLKWQQPARDNFFSSRLFYSHQLLLSRYFGRVLMLQFSPGMVHRNLATAADDRNDIFAMGMGGRVVLSPKFTLVADYQYVPSGQTAAPMYQPLTLGLDINTGGHVFQLHCSNSAGMNEKAFITQTGSPFGAGSLRFGFNLSRVF